MSLTKLSLAAIVVSSCVSGAFATSNTLEEAFKNGTVKGELKAYYFANESASHDKDSLFSMGALIGYKTDSLYGLSLGLTAQGSSSPFADQGAKADYSSVWDEYGSGAQLSEAYLAYTLGKTTLQVGRMFIDTPLVATGGSRVNKDAFEGATIVNTDLPNTTLIAGYVQKFQNRTDGNGNIGKFSKTFGTGSSGSYVADDGAFTLAVINNSIEGLSLTVAYAYANDLIQIGYAEALYTKKLSDVTYTLGGQYYYNNFDSSVSIGMDDTINAYAFKAGVSYKGLNGTIAYSQTSNDNVLDSTLISGLGNGADLLYTDSVITSPGYARDTKTYLIDLNYDLTKAANLGARYVLADDNFSDKQYAYTSIYGYYKFDASLKGLKVGAEFEDKGQDINGNNLWFKANYKF